MTCFRPILASLGLIALTACSLYDPTPRPDFTIHVMPTAKGNEAVPPACPSWTGPGASPFDNQPLPQFGCSTARNLAMMSDEPKDLVEGRPLGPSRGVHDVGAIRRYDNDKTRSIILPAAETNSAAVTSSASMSGDVTGGGSSSSMKAP